MDFIILNKINDYKNNSETNLFKNYNNKKNKSVDYFNNISTKTLDLKKKIKLLFNTNRKIAKKLFNIKKIKQHAISRKLKHICNLNKKDSFLNLENSLLNLVMASDFFFSEKDFLWFLKNSFITLNSLIVMNKFELIKPYDVITIVNSNYYYNFYKNLLSLLMLNIYKINLKLWSITKNRKDVMYFRGEKVINSAENYPNFFENYKYFKKDLPLNIEVDYVCMTIVLLYYNKNNKYFNFYNTKFFNFYLNRLYN